MLSIHATKIVDALGDDDPAVRWAVVAVLSAFDPNVLAQQALPAIDKLVQQRDMCTCALAHSQRTLLANSSQLTWLRSSKTRSAFAHTVTNVVE